MPTPSDVRAWMRDSRLAKRDSCLRFVGRIAWRDLDWRSLLGWDCSLAVGAMWAGSTSRGGRTLELSYLVAGRYSHQ